MHPVFQHSTYDGLLYNPSISHDEWNVLAATEGFPRRNPSGEQLAGATGLHRNTIIAVQRGLSHRHERLTFYMQVEDEPGQMMECPGYLIGPKGHYVLLESPVIYDRPTNQDRDESRRFIRPTRLHRVAPWLKAGGHTFIPRAVTRKLSRGQGKSSISLYLRILAAYVDEQHRRGCVQIDDATLAAKIGATPRQVAKYRRQMLADKIIKTVKGSRGTAWTVTGATPKNPRKPADLNPKMTRRLHTVELGEYAFTVLASEGEMKKIGHLLDQAEEGATKLAAALHHVDEWQPKTPVPASAIIAGLLEILRIQPCRATRLFISLCENGIPDGVLTHTRWSTGFMPKASLGTRTRTEEPAHQADESYVKSHPEETEDQEPSTEASDTPRETPAGDGTPPGQPAGESTERPTATEGGSQVIPTSTSRRDSALHEWSERRGTFCYGTPQEVEVLDEYYEALCSKYGAENGEAEWASIVACGHRGMNHLNQRGYGHKAHAVKIIRAFKNRWPDLLAVEPSQASIDIAHLLDKMSMSPPEDDE